MSKTVPARIQRALRAHQSAGDPLAALDAARILREEAETLERDSVDAVRAAGMSWSKIGALYGLTKQGAQQRFRSDSSGRTDLRKPEGAGAEEQRAEG